MGELYMEKLDSPWTMIGVENAGEIPPDKVGEDVVVPVAPLLTDLKAQLMFVPRSLVYTVGWRALVWQNKETGKFQDLTEEEYAAYMDGGIVAYTRGGGENATKDEGTEGDSGSNTL
jgi:hypothetical protein